VEAPSWSYSGFARENVRRVIQAVFSFSVRERKGRAEITEKSVTA